MSSYIRPELCAFFFTIEKQEQLTSIASFINIIELLQQLRVDCCSGVICLVGLCPYFMMACNNTHDQNQR